MVEFLLVVIAALLVGVIIILLGMKKELKMLDEWRYEWWQRTPRIESRAKFMQEIYETDEQ